MVTQFTTAYRSTAPYGVFAERAALTMRDSVLRDAARGGAIAEKSVRPVVTVTDSHSAGQFRLLNDALTCPAATSEITTPAANFWKQLIGGSGPPAPEPLLLT